MQIKRYIERHGHWLEIGKRRFLLLRIEESLATPRLLLAEGARALVGVPIAGQRQESWAIVQPHAPRRRIAAFSVDGERLAQILA